MDTHDSTYKSQSSPEVRPVSYKKLSDNPEKRKEQISKLTKAIKNINDELLKNTVWSEMQESYTKLNYYLYSLSPEDRYDLTIELDKNNLLNKNTFALLTFDNSSIFLDKNKFPELKSHPVFQSENFTEIVNLLKRNDLESYISPIIFDTCATDDAKEYFLSVDKIKDSNNLIEFLENSDKYFNLSPVEILQIFYDITNNLKYTSDTDYYQNSTIVLRALNTEFKNNKSKISKEEFKEIMQLFLSQRNENYINFHNIAFKNEVTLEIYRDIIRDYQEYGYGLEEIISDLNTLGPTFTIYLLGYFKEDRQRVLDAALESYKKGIKESQNNGIENLSYNFLDLRDIHYLSNPLKVLFLQQYDDLDNYDLNNVISLINQYPNIDLGPSYFNYALSTSNPSIFLEHLFLSNNMLNDFAFAFNSTGLTTENQITIERLLQSSNIEDFKKLGFNTTQIFKLMTSNNYLGGRLLSNPEENLKEFSQELLLQLFRIYLKNKETYNICKLIGLIEISEDIDIAELIDLVLNPDVDPNILIKSILDSKNINIIDSKFINSIFNKFPRLSPDIYVKIAQNIDSIPNFTNEDFIKLILRKGEVQKALEIFRYNPNFIPIENIKKLIFENLDEINVSNLEFIYASPTLSEAEKDKILVERVTHSPLIFKDLLMSFSKNKFSIDLYRKYIEQITDYLSNLSDKNKRDEYLINLSGVITKLYEEKDVFSDDFFLEFVKLYISKIKTENKLSDYINENDIRNQLIQYNRLPNTLIEALNLNFDQKILASIKKIRSPQLYNKSVSLISNTLSIINRSSTENFNSREIENFYNKHASNIPLELFIQLYLKQKDNLEIFTKLNEIYSLKLGKKTIEHLNFLIITSLSSSFPLSIPTILNNLIKLNFNNRRIINRELTNLKAICSILQSKILDVSEFQEFNEVINKNPENFYIESEKFILEKLSKIFPKVNPEILIRLKEFYVDLEPFITYVNNVNPPPVPEEFYTYLEEIMNNINPGNSDEWKKWRYDISNPSVSSQLEFLDQDGLDIWREDKIVLLNEYYLQIGAYDESITQSRNELTKYLKTVLRSLNPNNDSGIISKFTAELLNNFENSSSQDEFELSLIQTNSNLNEISLHLRIVGEFQSVEKIKKYYESLFTLDFFQKDKNKFNELAYFKGILNEQELREIRERWSKYGSFEEVFSIEIQDKIKKYFIEKNINFTNSFQTLKRLGVNLNLAEETTEENIKSNMERIRRIRKDIEFIQKTMSLLNVTAQEISNGRFDRENNSEDINSVINFLTTHIVTDSSKESEKILNTLLSRKDLVSQSGEVVVLITDNPFLMINIGKYPPGSGSCQNYESGGYNKALLGYVGDAKTKGVFVLKLDKLSPKTQEIIKTKGIGGIYNTPYESEVLDALIGRSIIKLGSTHSTREDQDYEKPAIIVQPTYTSVNKADTSLNQIIIDSVIGGYADDLGAEVYIINGTTEIQLSQSRSPLGEYDDGNKNGTNIGMVSSDYQITGTKVY